MSGSFVNGHGTPRLMRQFGKTVGWIIMSVNNGDGTSTLTTSRPHGLYPQMEISIAGSSTSIDGVWTITSTPAANQLLITGMASAGETEASFESLAYLYQSSNSTVFTATTAQDTGASLSMCRANLRVASWVTSGGIDYPTFSKILSVSADTLTIDGWSNGTPNNGQVFEIDGFIVDLPRTGEAGLTEEFTPVMLVHDLYDTEFASRQDTKLQGYQYRCTLDYSKYIATTVLMAIAPIFAAKQMDLVSLQPRNDAPFWYNVYADKPIAMRKLPKEGYEAMSFVFRSKENLPGLPVLSGYGSNYAFDYGTDL